MPFYKKLNLQFFAADDNGGGNNGGADDPAGTGDNPQDNNNDDPNDNPQDGKTFDEDYVKQLRNENAKHRTKNKQLEGKLDTVLKALGIKDGDTDPEQLSQQLTNKDNEIKSLKIENAFSRTASKVGADAELTLAVLKASGKLSDLDPDSKTFSDDLESVVKEAIKANPKLKANAPTKTGTTPPDNQGGGSAKDMNSMIRRIAGR